MTLFNPSPRTRPNRWIVSSLVLHTLLLAAILLHRQGWVAPMKLPGDAQGHRMTLTFNPRRSAPQSAVATPHPVKATSALSFLKAPAKPVQQAATSATPGTVNSTAATGNDAFGNGNVTVALATFFPRPTPELPAHTRGDVIVDVVIDETGRITTSKVTQSLAPAIDETVLATIQTWTFKPATRDGVPVASEQELLFHYERG